MNRIRTHDLCIHDTVFCTGEGRKENAYIKNTFKKRKKKRKQSRRKESRKKKTRRKKKEKKKKMMIMMWMVVMMVMKMKWNKNKTFNCHKECSDKSRREN